MKLHENELKQFAIIIRVYANIELKFAFSMSFSQSARQKQQHPIVPGWIPPSQYHTSLRSITLQLVQPVKKKRNEFRNK